MDLSDSNDRPMYRIIILALAIAILIAGWYALITRGPTETPAADSRDAETTAEHTENQDVEPAAAQSLIGSWQSTEDAKFVRVFTEDGSTEDRYEGSVVAGGTWRLFTSANAPEVSFPIEEDTVYLVIDDGTERLHFKVVSVTPERLELIYLERGGALSFIRI